ncbi:MAG: NADH-quinone oxidoreductase subunit N [Bacteriovoracaceae bacterium]|nr:NADH-quinone oxidoreductase subunit N [Bacteroidota bacterium]
MEFFSPSDLIGSSPILALSAFSLIALLANALVKNSAKTVFYISVVGILAAIGCAMYTFSMNATAFSDMLLVGGYASFFAVLFLVVALFSLCIAKPYLEREQYHFGEYYVLIMLSTIGMLMLGASADLITAFLGIEVMSVAFYVLAGYYRGKLSSNESALKYFLLGAFSTGFLLYGIALIYGTTGTTNLLRIVTMYPQAFGDPVHIIGWGLILIGFGFKVAAVPFHMWVPDVYEGAPTPVTAFMSTGGKAAAFSAFVIAFSVPMSMKDERLMLVVAVLAASSMLLGNWFGLSQLNLKRMLAYSSIAHAGYMLVGLASATSLGQQGITFYLVSYAFTNLGAFGIIAMLEKVNGANLSYEDYAGLAKRRPGLAALMAMFMFSLTGIPPFAGFVGKYYLFASAVHSNLTWLAIFGVMTSLFSTYYYLRVVVYMYFREATNTEEIILPKLTFATVIVCAVGILLFGIFPALIFDLMKSMF